MRIVTELTKGWQFSGPAETWEEALGKPTETVDLPHTWNAEDGQGGGDYLQARCWYFRKLEITAPQEGQEVWIEFLAANQVCDVYLNGQKLGHHEGGYTAFRVNLTPALGTENLLAVAVDNRITPSIYPQRSDFSYYGGLYREVFLLTVPKAHFALGYCGGSGFTVTPQVQGDRAHVKAQVWTEGPARQVEITIAGETKTAPIENHTAILEFELAPVRLWNGLEDPYLYTAEAVLDSGDQVSTRFGCRSIGFDPDKGFLLNGKPYPLRGVAKHQDWLGVGNAITHEMMDEDMAIVLELGANTLRLAHYPHHPYFYDLCDEKGLVVWAEIPYISRHVPEGRESTLSQMRELVVQQYNHPSIVCWGLSNEIAMIGGVSEDMMENHRLLNDLCHRLDPTRPTTMAHENTLAQDSPLHDIPDISSYNLYFGWYKGVFEENGVFLDSFHQKHPQRCVGLSEYGADANIDLQAGKPVKGDFTETYQSLYHEHLLQTIEERPYLWATHVWNLFDFAAAHRNDGGVPGRNLKGLVTMDRKRRKDAFYLYKSHWNKEPMVYLCGSRYVDRTEDVTEVKVYSNQPQVSLYVNGRLVGTQEGPYVFRFTVPMSGEMEVTAKAGALADTIHIRKADAPNPAYTLPNRQNVLNWIDMDSHNRENCSIQDTLGSLLDNPAAHDRTLELINRLAPTLLADPDMAQFLREMALDRILNPSADKVSKEEVRDFNAFLQGIPKQPAR